MKQSGVHVQPWPFEDEPTQAYIRRLMDEEGLRPYLWANGPGDVYSAHTHPYHKVIYVVQGSITFGLPELARKVTLHAGDRLDLPPGIVHDAVVGPDGVACLEGHH